MGHKINPVSLRLGSYRAWNSFWYGDLDYSSLLSEDLQIRQYFDYLCNRFKISRGTPILKRWLNSTLLISSSFYDPNAGLGARNTSSSSFLKKSQIQNSVKKITGVTKSIFSPIPIKYKGSFFFFTVPISNAQLVAHYIAYELEKRNPFSEIVQDVMDWVSVSECLEGIHISCSGRFMGEDRSRTLWKKQGSIPFSTISSNVDYATSTAVSKYGAIGVKVWIYYK